MPRREEMQRAIARIALQDAAGAGFTPADSGATGDALIVRRLERIAGSERMAVRYSHSR
ncbi:hypothetical protein [Brevibacterium sandarakinum]|uniref:hypothetical protein n=1 Tax=Brevibacterium sandarakinum TaxID=629680 RepID=UPI0012FD6B3C|nr:hypothetical protein [Brevibacterium sandarakinum]